MMWWAIFVLVLLIGTAVLLWVWSCVPRRRATKENIKKKHYPGRSQCGLCHGSGQVLGAHNELVPCWWCVSYFRGDIV